MENSVFELGNLEAEIEKLTHAIQEKAELLDSQATTIHDKRLEAIPVLSQKLIVILETLGMPNVRFDIQVKQSKRIMLMVKMKFNFYFRPIKELILEY